MEGGGPYKKDHSIQGPKMSWPYLWEQPCFFQINTELAAKVW